MSNSSHLHSNRNSSSSSSSSSEPPPEHHPSDLHNSNPSTPLLPNYPPNHQLNGTATLTSSIANISNTILVSPFNLHISDLPSHKLIHTLISLTFSGYWHACNGPWLCCRWSPTRLLHGSDLRWNGLLWTLTAFTLCSSSGCTSSSIFILCHRFSHLSSWSLGVWSGDCDQMFWRLNLLSLNLW